MLVITRRPGQAVWIGDNICVQVLDSNDHQVRLGFHAPKEIVIDPHAPPKLRHVLTNRDTPPRDNEG